MRRMLRSGLLWPSTIIAYALLGLLRLDVQTNAAGDSALAPNLPAERTTPAELEVAGDLAGVPVGATRYLTRADLLSLSQVTLTVRDDNFAQPTRVSGVPIEELARDLGAAPSATVVAICDDKYRANYSRAYLAEHHPVLVLSVVGKPPSGWPKASGGYDMGPYLISHAKFTPAFKIRSYSDEPQIPWGVQRLEFRKEAAVFGAIAPHGSVRERPRCTGRLQVRTAELRPLSQHGR